MSDHDKDHAALLEEENAAEIDEHRGDLNEQIAQALAAISAAEQHITHLMSDRVYDVELADGADGPDVVSHLRDAHRSVRAARAVFRYATAP